MPQMNHAMMFLKMSTGLYTILSVCIPINYIYYYNTCSTRICYGTYYYVVKFEVRSRYNNIYNMMLYSV